MLSLADCYYGRLRRDGGPRCWDALEVFHAFQGVHLPRLEELRVTGEGYDRPLCAPSWISPNLRSLRCSGYSLSPSAAAFSSVTTISLSLHLHQFGSYFGLANAALALLDSSSTPSVTSVELELHNVTSIGLAKSETFTPSVCPSVTSFHLRLRGQYVGGSQELYTIVSSGSAYASCGGPVRLRRRLGHGGKRK